MYLYRPATFIVDSTEVDNLALQSAQVGGGSAVLAQMAKPGGEPLEEYDEYVLVVMRAIGFLVPQVAGANH